MLLLEAHDLRFAYGKGGFALGVSAFRGMGGEAIALRGPSGAGKTTLLKLLAGILPLNGGSIAINGQSLSQLPPVEVRRLRLREMGLVFQEFALLDYLTVMDNVLLPLRLSGALKPEHPGRVRNLLQALDLETHATRLAGELSQGERQRVAVARALVHEPRVVLADEPTSALDAARGKMVQDLLLRHVRERQALLIMVSHDASVAAAMHREVVVGEGGACL